MSAIWPQGLTVEQSQAVVVLLTMVAMLAMIIGLLVAMYLERRVR